MLSFRFEKALLQIAVSFACLVPLAAGLSGVIAGTDFLNSNSSIDLDNHFRYLSGLLLGIGLGFLSTVPHIERHNAHIKILTFIVVVGGLGRMLGILLEGLPSIEMILALCMELLVTPLLCFWQYRLAQRFRCRENHPVA